MKVEVTDGITIAREPVRPGSRADRHAREREAVSRALESLLGRGVELSHTPSGAPVLPACQGLNISISHSLSQVVIAIGRVPRLGVDTETLRPQLERVVDKYLSPREQALFATPLERLYAWCVKEAAYKAAAVEGVDFATGICIADDGNEVSVGNLCLKIVTVELSAESTTVIVF